MNLYEVIAISIIVGSLIAALVWYIRSIPADKKAQKALDEKLEDDRIFDSMNNRWITVEQAEEGVPFKFKSFNESVTVKFKLKENPVGTLDELCEYIFYKLQEAGINQRDNHNESRIDHNEHELIVYGDNSNELVSIIEPIIRTYNDFEEYIIVVNNDQTEKK